MLPQSTYQAAEELTIKTVTGLRKSDSDEVINAGGVDARIGGTTRHVGYALSQKRRKLIEEAFGCRRC